MIADSSGQTVVHVYTSTVHVYDNLCFRCTLASRWIDGISFLLYFISNYKQPLNIHVY